MSLKELKLPSSVVELVNATVRPKGVYRFWEKITYISAYTDFVMLRTLEIPKII